MKLLLILSTLLFAEVVFAGEKVNSSDWLLVDDFEKNDLSAWEKRDTKNNTSPKIDNPQITQIEKEDSGNYYLIKKPAAEGVVGNRKALSFVKLPSAVEVGEVYTFYTRINVEYFPNNHVFGLSNLDPEGIAEHDYNAFEPSLRITDWYEVWYVVNNDKYDNGGQRYNVYIRGGEFTEQTLVYQNADFRMKRELPLTYFLTNCNTGPADQPYGNGGIRYDDIYMAKGLNLSLPFSL